MTPRTAQTSAPVLEHIATRWSPRSFDGEHAIPEGALRGAFEAARWSASANNTQPWRFIVARRGSETFRKIEDTLVGFNRLWAGSAAAMVVNIAETHDADGAPRVWAEYDLGQAVAHLVMQAHSEGLHTHQMGGFDREAIRAAFELEDRFLPISIVAIGAIGSPEQLPEQLRERELAPRTRLPLEDLILLND
ncbi:nitroreductase family protein [Leucobacter sp. CSA1]|uniref:Nitroreductase family protein n=1 Tax=Leucobacter chromiisoli TaxID=2796471 RepID=A0A934Q329_9MICO|nr:nitroreductase family protein [Leucobacter chromiisoli]MBK0417509.1 nitroreductase family protein [Leucobacter chromiisoli]